MQESEQTYRIKSYLLLFVHLQSKCYRRPIFFSFHLFLLDCWTKRPNKNNIFTSLFVLRKIWLFIIYQRFSNLSLLLPLHPTHHVHIESCNNTILLRGLWHLSPILRKKENLQFNVCESFAQSQNITYLPTWITLFYSSIKIHQNIVTI